MANIGPLAIAAICEGIINLVISLILVRYIGVIGVAIGTIIPNLVNNGIWMPLYISRVINIKLKTLILRSMAPGIVVGLTGYVSSFFIGKFMHSTTWVSFVLSISFVSLICFTVAISIKLLLKDSFVMKQNYSC